MKRKHKKKKLVSICVPVLNEEQNIESLYLELSSLSNKVKHEFDFEFIFTDNRSSDLTWEKIKRIQKNDPRIHGYKFSKNIGFQQSIYFNYMQAKGDAIVQIDADLQDPPVIILEFLAGWVEGYKVVVGVRRGRSESGYLNNLRKIGYAVISRISRFRITENAGDFRLIDREVVELLRQSQNPEPYLRGAIAGFAYPEKEIIYDRKARMVGQSKISFLSTVKLGLKGVINYSNFLLKASQVTFMFSLLLSLSGITLYAISRILTKNSNYPPGFTTVVLLILLSLTINSLFFAVCIKYVQAIHHVITRNEPIVVLEKIE